MCSSGGLGLGLGLGLGFGLGRNLGSASVAAVLAQSMALSPLLPIPHRHTATTNTKQGGHAPGLCHAAAGGGGHPCQGAAPQQRVRGARVHRSVSAGRQRPLLCLALASSTSGGPLHLPLPPPSHPPRPPTPPNPPHPNRPQPTQNNTHTHQQATSSTWPATMSAGWTTRSPSGSTRGAPPSRRCWCW